MSHLNQSTQLLLWHETECTPGKLDTINIFAAINNNNADQQNAL